jgi:hypothetical protein
MTHGTDDLEQYAELAALADGTLSERRRAQLEDEVAASPQLQALLAEQQSAVDRFRSLEVAAPARLRAELTDRGARVGVSRAPKRERRFRVPRLTWPQGLAGATAVAALIALVVLVVSGTSAPSVAAAAELGQRPPTSPAPAAQAGQPKLLAADVSGVPFPNWLGKFGWRATGARADHVGGRRAVTIFYSKGTRRLAYTIVSGSALKVPAGGVPAVREGTKLLSFNGLAGRPTVVWTRGGHTCILSGVGVPRATMLELAGWKGKGVVPF